MNLMNQDLIVILIGYLRGMADLDVVREWLAENVWELSGSASPLDRMLLGELELALAEYDRGDRDEEYLRKQVWFLLQLPNPEVSPMLREAKSVSFAV